jgi:hypothetical protein
MVGGQPKPDTAVSSSLSLRFLSPTRTDRPLHFLPAVGAGRCSLPCLLAASKFLPLARCCRELCSLPTSQLPAWRPPTPRPPRHRRRTSLLGPSRRNRSPKSSRMHILWRSGSAQARHAIGQATLSWRRRRRRLGHGRRVHRIRGGGQPQFQGNSCLS